MAKMDLSSGRVPHACLICAPSRDAALAEARRMAAAALCSDIAALYEYCTAPGGLSEALTGDGSAALLCFCGSSPEAHVASEKINITARTIAVIFFISDPHFFHKYPFGIPDPLSFILPFHHNCL